MAIGAKGKVVHEIGGTNEDLSKLPARLIPQHDSRFFPGTGQERPVGTCGERADRVFMTIHFAKLCAIWRIPHSNHAVPSGASECTAINVKRNSRGDTERTL